MQVASQPRSTVADPPPLPRRLGALAIRDTTFAAAADQSARFDVQWTGDDALLAPRSKLASSLLDDPASTSRIDALQAVISSHASSGVNRLARFTLAPTTDAWIAARLLPRVEHTLATATSPRTGTARALKTIRVGAPMFERQKVDGEFIPLANEMVIGTAASRTLLGLPGTEEEPAASDTRATYVLRHELAHAATPVEQDALADRVTHTYEEGRADLIARADPHLAQLAGRLGLRFDADELAHDRTYPFQRSAVSMLLEAAAMLPGSPAAARLLTSTTGERLPEALGAAIAARAGLDADDVSARIRGASGSLKELRTLLADLGVGA